VVRRDNLIRRPKHNVGLNRGVQITDHLFVRVDGEYNTERTDVFFNPANKFAQEDISLDAYTLLNLYAEYQIPYFQAAVFTDIRYLLNTDFTEVYGFNTSGFALIGGIRFRF